MPLPEIDQTKFLGTLQTLLNIPSPTGRTDEAMRWVADQLTGVPGLECFYSRKGALVAKWNGESDAHPRGLTAHVDTLGGMVKEIRGNGRLTISRLGGLTLNSVEAEHCVVFASNGREFSGSYLFEKASVHVYGKDVNETQRAEANMEIRLDERVSTPDEVSQLGIRIGDFVAFDPRVVIKNGFVRSRFLDDKACVANLIAAIQTLSAAGLRPKFTSYFLFSNYEEVGHGAAAGLPAEVRELLTVDMAAVGTGQASNEFNTTLCVKDSGGPYHHGFSNRLREIADENGIGYVTDIYPYYGSDGEAAWRAGADMAVALIGPGVDASHHYERTHVDALNATTKWVMAYLLSDAV